MQRYSGKKDYGENRADIKQWQAFDAHPPYSQSAYEERANNGNAIRYYPAISDGQ